VREERVGADADHGDGLVLELFGERLEAFDLGRAHEREVERVPVEDVPAAAVVLAADGALLAVQVCDACPGGLGFSNGNHAMPPCVTVLRR
jgi:hypothetical protein